MKTGEAKQGRKPHKTPLLGGTESRGTRPANTAAMRINPYAACVFRFRHNGKGHLYLNAGIPWGCHPSDAICTKCGHAYSHMAKAGQEKCRECLGDDLAAAAQRLESAGINLGWGFAEHTAEYVREGHQQYRAR